MRVKLSIVTLTFCSILLLILAFSNSPRSPSCAEVEKDAITINLPGDVKMRFKLISAGSCMIGSPEVEQGWEGVERPQDRVTISRPFSPEYKRLSINNGKQSPEKSGIMPDSTVSKSRTSG